MYVLGRTRDTRIGTRDTRIDTRDTRIDLVDDVRITPQKPPLFPPPSFPNTRPPPIAPVPEDSLDDGIGVVEEENRIDTDLEDQYTNEEMPEDVHEPFVPPEAGYPEVGEQPVGDGMEYPDVGDEYTYVDEDEPVEETTVITTMPVEKKFPWLLVGAGVGVIIYLMKKK
jgi:hypothetical protein